MTQEEKDQIIEYIMRINGISKEYAVYLFNSMDYVRKNVLRLVVDANREGKQ